MRSTFYVLRSYVYALVFTVVGFGCGVNSDEVAPTPTAEVNYYRDIAPILEKNCVNCHQAGGIAPFALETYEQAAAAAPAIADSVESRRMPPWPVENSGTCGTYRDARWLSEADIAVLGAWSDSGAKPGNEAERVELEPVSTELSNVSVTLEMEESYEPSSAALDDYRCFIVQSPQLEEAYLTAYHVRPGDSRLVHHVILYSVPDDGVAAEAEELDAAEAGPGYTCFGGPNLSNYGEIAAWAPGTPATNFPDGTGIYMAPHQIMVMQIHYNLMNGEGEDKTAIDLQLEEAVDQEAYIIISGDFDMVLPGGLAEARTVMETSPADLGGPIDVTVYGVFPHMHLLGQTIELDFVNETGPYCMSRVASWDFNWQQFYFFDEPLAVRADEIVRLQCSYDTSTHDTMVGWGEGTLDEMCVLGYYVTIGVTDSTKSPSNSNRSVDDFSGTSAIGSPYASQGSLSVGGNQNDTVNDVLMLNSGEQVVVGATDNMVLNFGGELQFAPGNGDGYIARYDHAGAYLWSRFVGGSENDAVTNVAETASGNLIVSGTYTSSDLELGDNRLENQGGRDLFVMEMSVDGSVTWVRTFGGTGNDRVRDLDLASDGSIVVGGDFEATVDFGNGIRTTGGSDANGMVLLLDADGNVLADLIMSSSSRSEVRSVSVLSSGQVIVGGSFYGDLEVDSATLTGRGDGDAYIASLELPAGICNWVLQLGDTYRDTVRAVTNDGKGSIAVTGLFSGVIGDGQTMARFQGSSDMFVASLTTEGVVRWIRGLGGIAGDEGTAVTFLPEGHVLAAGEFEASAVIENGSLKTAGKGDILLVEFDADGNQLSGQQVGGIGWDNQPRLATRDDGAVLMGFSSTGRVTLGEAAFDNQGGSDIVLVRWARNVQ